MGFTIAFLLFIFLALGIGAVFAVGAPVFAIPIFLVVALVIFGGLMSGRSVLRRQGQYRRMRSFRRQSKAQRDPITPEDRRTVV